MMNILSKKLQSFHSSKDYITLVSNFGYLSLLQVAGYIFPLITMPYLARVIGPEGFGKLAFASAVVMWIQTISDWGFNYTATRDVAQNRDDKDKVSRIFSNVLWARCFLTVFSSVILTILVLVIPYLRENALVIYATFFMVPGHVLFPEWFFQAIERMKYTTIFNLVLKFFFTIMIFFIVKEPDDYIWSPLLTSIGYVICGLGSLNLILNSWGYKLYKPQLKEIYSTILRSTDVFINNLMPNLYNSFSVMLLGFFSGVSANGIYDGGNKFPTIFYNLQGVISRTFYPFLSRRADKHKFFSFLYIGMSIIGAIILVILSPLLINIFLGSQFSDSVSIMQILSVSIIFLAISNTYGTNYLILRHHERELRNITIISSIVGMASAVPLVYYYDAIGVALTVAFSRFLLGFLSFVGFIKIERKKSFLI